MILPKILITGITVGNTTIEIKPIEIRPGSEVKFIMEAHPHTQDEIDQILGKKKLKLKQEPNDR